MLHEDVPGTWLGHAKKHIKCHQRQVVQKTNIHCLLEKNGFGLCRTLRISGAYGSKTIGSAAELADHRDS